MTAAKRNEYIQARKLLDLMRTPLLLHQLETLMLELTRQHWAHAANHGPMASIFEHAEYDFDAPDDSTMGVDLQDAFVEAEISSPGIYIAGTEATFVKVATGNLEGYNDDNSERTSVWRCITGVLAAHVNPSSTLAKAAAESTLAFWTAIGPVLCTRLELSAFDPQKIAAAVKLDKSPDRMYRVDVSVQIVFTWSVSITQESHRLKLTMSEINPEPQ